MDTVRASPGIEWAADALPCKAHHAHEILSAIINHDPLPSTLQMIADTLVAQLPSKGIAIFLGSGPQFQLVAEAGLPRRMTGILSSTDASGLTNDAPWLPTVKQIVDSGLDLCSASPLISHSGEANGALAVFDRQQGLLDDTTRDTIQNLGDLARMAIEHGQLYDELVHRSQFDHLTGLPNRLFLEERLQQAMILARQQGTLVGVCCIDLDRFKQINDHLGYELGDALFKLVSERLTLSLRAGDTLARPAGDEFILTLPALTEASQAAAICQGLLQDLGEPFLLDGHSLHVNASVGISIFPQQGDTAELLLRNADIALHAAKRAGGGEALIYSPALGQQTRRAAELVDALVGALAQVQFRMVYQPIYTMSREIVGFEALLRWKHATWGQISPLEFIPIAEKTGLIVAIGDWVIDEVCRQAMEWDAAGLLPVKLFANISGVQLERRDFSLKIAEALARSGLAPDRLELEITESWIISDLRGAATKLQKLRDLGIGIAIDDFGTGHSTFNYLQQLPLDTLKIDRSFIHRLDTIRAITVLAQQMGLKTVAEGVESEKQWQQLSEIGCELMQGFFFSRPLDPDAACSLLRAQSLLLAAS